MKTKRSNKKRKKRRTYASVSSKAVKRNHFHKIESFLKKWKFTIALVVCFISAVGWFMEYIKQNGRESPEIATYNIPAEELDTSIQSYFQMPRYKTGFIEIGGTFVFEKSDVFMYSISPHLLGSRTVLILKVANEDSDRVYYLDEPYAIPLTIYLKVMSKQFLITVEDYDESRIQIRTYVEKARDN
jgi:hypothetical protein